MNLYEAIIRYVDARIEHEFSQKEPNKLIRELEEEHFEKTKDELKTICDSVAFMFYPKER